MTSYPATQAYPLAAGLYVVRIRMVVVFPAPVSPGATSNDTWSTASTEPYCFVRFWTWIAGCVMDLSASKPVVGDVAESLLYYAVQGRQVCTTGTVQSAETAPFGDAEADMKRGG